MPEKPSRICLSRHVGLYVTAMMMASALFCTPEAKADSVVETKPAAAQYAEPTEQEIIQNFIAAIAQMEKEASQLKAELASVMKAGKWPSPEQRDDFIKRLTEFHASFEPKITLWERFDLSRVPGGEEAGKRMFVLIEENVRNVLPAGLGI